MREGWEIKTLGDICDRGSSNVSQNTLENDNGDYPIFGASGLIKNVSFYHQEKAYIGIVKDGAGIGRTTMLPAYSSVIGTLQYLIPKDNIDIKFLDFFLKGIDFLKYKQGSTIPHIYFKDYSAAKIVVPPLPEQKQIVAIIDKAFAAIDKAKANAEKNLQNAKDLFESYLQNVFEKKGDDWEEKTLLEVTSKIGSGATPRGGNESYKTEGISLVRSMNVHDFEFRERNLAFIDDKQAKELNNVTLQEEDVLLNITGASVARCCIIPKEYLPARVNQHVSIIRAKKDIITPAFLNLLLTSKFYKDQLLFTGEQGATRQAITKAQLEVFRITFPKSIKEQQITIQKLNQLSSETKKLETIYEQKLKDLEELKKSILQKAFSGELITQKESVAV